MIYVGTSGWVYADWRGRFYPSDLSQAEWLPYFSHRFRTVEVNNSFYRLPSETMVQRWRRDSAKDFVIAVKASRFITHIKRLRDCGEPLQLLWSRARLLGDKLGPVLFQLPPRFPSDTARLREFVSLLPHGMRAAFEFRDRSWENDDTFAILDDAGAAFVWADKPGARVPAVVTGGWAYVRFHQGTTSSPWYAHGKLNRWADRIASLRATDVDVYFNNDPQGAAIADATFLIEALRRRGARVAPPASERHARAATG